MKIRHFFSFLTICLIFVTMSIFLDGASKPILNSVSGIQSGVAAAVKGYVKDARTGEVIPDAKVVIVYAKSESVRYMLETDKKGYFYKSGLTPGYY